MAELGADESAAQDGQAPRQVGQAHDRVGRFVFPIRQARDRGYRWPRAGRDHNGLGVQLYAVHLDLLMADEACRPPEDRDAVGAPVALQNIRRVAIDLDERSLDDGWPIDLVDRRVDAETPGIGDGASDIRHVDEHLGRNAAPVQAGPTERSFLDDGHSPAALGGGGRNLQAGPGPDDDEIELLHHCLPVLAKRVE